MTPPDLTAPELLPCPFCGGTKIKWTRMWAYSNDSSYAIFGCAVCGANFPAESDDAELTEDHKNWNRRADHSRLREEVERLRAALESAKIKLNRYMEIHGPGVHGDLANSYVGGLWVEYQASLAVISAALKENSDG